MSQALFTGSDFFPNICKTCPMLTKIWLRKLRRDLAVALTLPLGLLVSGFLGWLSFQVRFFFLHLFFFIWSWANLMICWHGRGWMPISFRRGSATLASTIQLCLQHKINSIDILSLFPFKGSSFASRQKYKRWYGKRGKSALIQTLYRSWELLVYFN